MLLPYFEILICHKSNMSHERFRSPKRGVMA
jgi:hypothetical protein